MHSSDLIGSQRLEQLLRGAPPEGELEADLQALVRELRSSAVQAPVALRERVRAVPEPVPRRLPRVTWRRAALVLAPAFVAAVGAALVAGAPRLGDRSEGESTPLRRTERAVPAGASQLDGSSTGNFAPALAPGSTTRPKLQVLQAAPIGDSRARDVDMWIELRLRDADGLSEAANEAMRVARELGGFVASSTVGTRGQEGRAELVLRVPVGRVEDALFRLSQLGTITGQRVATTDLQSRIDGHSRRIAGVRRAITIGELKLRSGTLNSGERLELEIKLARQRSLLAELRRARTSLLRDAAIAELSLTLHTRAVPAVREDESLLGGAARDGLGFLGRAGSVALFLAIVLSPFLLLSTFLWLALRGRSRRVDHRLLERSRPAAPTPEAPAS